MSFNALFDQNGSPIVYPLVKEILPDGSYTLYRYSSFAQYPDSLPDIYHALRCRYDARTSELFVTHLPSPNFLCMATWSVAGTKPVIQPTGPYKCGNAIVTI
ncbi:MAG: hypothetical protein ACLR8Y_15915 [Alistipes indistinctus]